MQARAHIHSVDCFFLCMCIIFILKICHFGFVLSQISLTILTKLI